MYNLDTQLVNTKKQITDKSYKNVNNVFAIKQIKVIVGNSNINKMILLLRCLSHLSD